MVRVSLDLVSTISYQLDNWDVEKKKHLFMYYIQICLSYSKCNMFVYTAIMLIKVE